MTTVYFVRHAEPNYANHDDASRALSPKGMQDRKLVTAFLADKNINVALSSPFKRAIDTIKDFTDGANLAIQTIDDFRERRVDSEWIPDFTAFSKRQWSDFSYKLSDGECLQEVLERNISALNRVIASYKGANIVIGSHGTALSSILHHYNSAFGYDDFEKIKNKMPWIVKFVFEDDKSQPSITMIDLI